MEHWWNDTDRGEWSIGGMILTGETRRLKLICITYFIENTMIPIDDCSKPTGKQRMCIVRITWNTNIQRGKNDGGLLLR